MRLSRWPRLLAIAAAVAVVGWLLLRMWEMRGFVVPTVPWLVVLVMLAIAATVLSLGWSVRQFQRGKRPGLDPLRAARTAVLAKAACYTGTILTGWYGAQVLLVIGELDIAARRDKAVMAAIAVVAAVVLAVSGYVVERFCRIPPAGDGPEDTEIDPQGAPAA